MAGEPTGYLVLRRKLFSSDLWAGNQEPYCRRAALVDLLQRAAYAPHFRRVGKGRHPVRLEEGELLASTRELGKRWRWDKNKVNRFLLHLQERGTLTSRPAWNEPPASKILVPTVYRFPRFLEHQGQPSSGTGSVGQATCPETLAFPGLGGTGSMGQAESEDIEQVGQARGTGSVGQATPPCLLKEPHMGGTGSVGQARGTGSSKSGTGNMPGNIDVSPPRRDRLKNKGVLENKEITTLSILLTGREPKKNLDTFAAVQELAALLDHYGANGAESPHRGLNVSGLLKQVKNGADPSSLAHIIRGTRILADQGRVPWIPPGQPFSIAGIFGDQRHIGARALSSLALEVSHATDTDP
jgi:hypothetical protein